MSRPQRRHRHASVAIESLEARTLLAAFGTPWPEARDLSISFPADGVPVGRVENRLHAELDQIAPTQQWQELVLRAYQTWALHADINVGLRNDYDLAFGSPGLMTDDPRFGEFRIGAFPQEGLLASSLPFQAVAGTYSGDLLLNANETFRFHDWNEQIAPDTSLWDGDDRDLYSLLLHEVGNTLGIDDNDLDWTVMFGQYIGPKGVLTAEDIAEIQNLYGQRSDPYELADNDDVQFATVVPNPLGFNAATDVIRARGSLVTGTDVDHYQVVSIDAATRVSIRIQAAGTSLVESRLEVFDAAGNVLAQSQAESVFRNDHGITIENVTPGTPLTIRVSSLDAGSVYAVGDYLLEVDYRDPSVQAADATPGDHQSGADALFTNFDLLDDEIQVNDTIDDAAPIDSTSALDYRFEWQSSVASSGDVDVWKVTAPSSAEQRLVIQLAGVGAESPDLRVRVLDADGVAVGTSGRLLGDGTWTLEVAAPEAGQDYFIRVSVDPSSAVDVGNYIAVAEFTQSHEQLNEVVSGSVSSDVDEFFSWTVGKSKLYRFDLSASGGQSGESVRMRIYDAHTRQLKLIVTAQDGMTRNGFAWLQEGEYIIRMTAFGQADDALTTLDFALTSDGISDDQDLDGDNPDNDPYYDPYEFYQAEYNAGYYYSPYEYYYDWDQYYEYEYEYYYDSSAP